MDAPTRKIGFREEFWSKHDPGFLSPKTFCFAEMKSRVFKIVLEGSFQRSCYEPGSTILKTRDFIEAKLKVWGDKKKSGSFGTKCWEKLIPQRWTMLQKKRENIIFLPLEKVFKIKPGWKAHSRNPGKKVVKKPFFPTSYGVILENKKRKKRSFINWNEHRETKNARIGTKTVLRVKMYVIGNYWK